jgi:5-methylcytosine-specific restriction endonuclease McrA
MPIISRLSKNNKFKIYSDHDEFTDVAGFKWVSMEAFIHWLFNGRCLVCKKSGAEINEIVPRSRSKASIKDWKNRVLMCNDCHTQYHHDGVSIEKLKLLQVTRREFLKSCGKEKYV